MQCATASAAIQGIDFASALSSLSPGIFLEGRLRHGRAVREGVVAVVVFGCGPQERIARFGRMRSACGRSVRGVRSALTRPGRRLGRSLSLPAGIGPRGNGRHDGSQPIARPRRALPAFGGSRVLVRRGHRFRLRFPSRRGPGRRAWSGRRSSSASSCTADTRGRASGTAGRGSDRRRGSSCMGC